MPLGRQVADDALERRHEHAPGRVVGALGVHDHRLGPLVVHVRRHVLVRLVFEDERADAQRVDHLLDLLVGAPGRGREAEDAELALLAVAHVLDGLDDVRLAHGTMALVDYDARYQIVRTDAPLDVVPERLRRAEVHAAAGVVPAGLPVLAAGPARHLHDGRLVESHEFLARLHLLRHQRLGRRDEDDLALREPPAEVLHDDGCDERLAQARRVANERVGKERPRDGMQLVLALGNLRRIHPVLRCVATHLDPAGGRAAARQVLDRRPPQHWPLLVVPVFVQRPARRRRRRRRRHLLLLLVVVGRRKGKHLLGRRKGKHLLRLLLLPWLLLGCHHPIPVVVVRRLEPVRRHVVLGRPSRHPSRVSLTLSVRPRRAPPPVRVVFLPLHHAIDPRGGQRRRMRPSLRGRLLRLLPDGGRPAPPHRLVLRLPRVLLHGIPHADILLPDRRPDGAGHLRRDRPGPPARGGPAPVCRPGDLLMTQLGLCQLREVDIVVIL